MNHDLRANKAIFLWQFITLIICSTQLEHAWADNALGKASVSIPAEDGSGRYSYANLAKKNYSDKTLRILVHEKPNMGEPVELHAQQFSKLTGVKLDITFVPFGQLYPSLLWGLKNKSYDVVFYGSLWLPDTQAYLAPMPKSMLESAQFQDVIPYHKGIASWNQQVLQVPIDGDRHYLQYRLDVFNDKIMQSQYRQTFGQPLRPPKTWKELNQLAAFFHGRKLANGETLNGIVEITKMDDLLFSNFIKRAAPYAKHPAVKGGFFFELESMAPLINTPGFVEALRDFITAQQYYPAGGDEYRLADVNRVFASGAAVFTDNWDDSFIYAMQEDGPLYNNVMPDISPGSRRVWNRRTARWDEFPDVNYAPYIAWGWTSAVTANSQVAEVAFDYLGFFANQANHKSDLKIGRFGVNPYRQADLKIALWQQSGWSADIARAYIDTFIRQSTLGNHVYDLRIHRVGLYMKALSIGIKRALTKRTSPQEALDDVAKKWNELNLKIGIDKQRKAYANVVKLEDAEH